MLNYAVFFWGGRGGQGFRYLNIPLFLFILLKDNPSLDEVRAGAPLRPNVSKGNVSTTPVGGLLLGLPPGSESFLILLVFVKKIGQYLTELFMDCYL